MSKQETKKRYQVSLEIEDYDLAEYTEKLRNSKVLRNTLVELLDLYMKFPKEVETLRIRNLSELNNLDIDLSTMSASMAKMEQLIDNANSVNNAAYTAYKDRSSISSATEALTGIEDDFEAVLGGKASSGATQAGPSFDVLHEDIKSLTGIVKQLTADMEHMKMMGMHAQMGGMYGGYMGMPPGNYQYAQPQPSMQQAYQQPVQQVQPVQPVQQVQQVQQVMTPQPQPIMEEPMTPAPSLADLVMAAEPMQEQSFGASEGTDSGEDDDMLSNFL